jgi:hypothetical protein
LHDDPQRQAAERVGEIVEALRTGSEAEVVPLPPRSGGAMNREWEIVDDSLYDLARGYLALVAYPPKVDGSDPEREQRADFIEDLRRFLAIHTPPEHRLADLQALPRRRDVVRATDVGVGRIVDHAYKASWLGWAMLKGRISTPEEGLAELFRREGKHAHTGGAIRMARKRRWERSLPVLYLAMPLVREMLWPPPKKGRRR